MANKNLPRRSSILSFMFIVFTVTFAYLLNQEKVDHQETRNDLIDEQATSARLVTDTVRLTEQRDSVMWLLKEVQKQNEFLKKTNKNFLGKSLTDSIIRENVELKMENAIIQHRLDDFEENASINERSQQILRLYNKTSTHPRGKELALKE